MISLYPGPSHVPPEAGIYMNDALDSGILSLNHRSKEFMKLLASTRKILYKRLEIPADYELIFTSSATECWEIMAQSLGDGLSYHLYNGAFGEKWFSYTQRIHPTALGFRYDPEVSLSTRNLDLSGDTSTICLTQNETSNGTKISNDILSKFSAKFPEPLIAIDATSSLAGENLTIASADIWYASVQKCFGLPSGMAIMICSPKAVERAYSVNERNHYNSLAFILDNFRDNQTPYTPNILGIYLLYRTMKSRSKISKVATRLEKRMKRLDKVIAKQNRVGHFIAEESVRSLTVRTLKGKSRDIGKIKKQALEAGFMLGNGYGSLKDTTFRIANFPAVKQSEWKEFLAFLKDILK